MKEGSLAAPTRHALAWREEAFYDPEAVDAEQRRVFDICHGCRRCFNLCDVFPRLFDLIDAAPSGELDTVSSTGFAHVAEACTLCDMCFMTKCPYVPPHEFDLDFPHLMLRARAAQTKPKGRGPFVRDQLARMDRNGRLGTRLAPLANWGARRGNALTRPALEKVFGLDADASLAPYARRPFAQQWQEQTQHSPRAPDGPARERKATLFTTCYVNYHRTRTGAAALAVLARQGVDVDVAYPGCCAMPFLEQGNIAAVAAAAARVAAALRPAVDAGRSIVTLTASCGLMLKFEWPLILPDNPDVAALAAAVRDIDEYVLDIARTCGLAPGLAPVAGGVAVHLACHARAQNMGPKAADMLRLLPDTKVHVVERCSGHGGLFGVLAPTHEVACKVGKPAVRAVAASGAAFVASDCPLAAQHLAQEARKQGRNAPEPAHPIEILAAAYGAAE